MVRIGTWNLVNLFAPDGKPARAAYEAKLDSLAHTITRREPDVLTAQEVGDPAALEDLVNVRRSGRPVKSTSDISAVAF